MKSTDTFEWDERLPGFGTRTRNGKTRHVVQYKIGLRQRRITLKNLTKPEARREALKILGEVAKGNDPQGARQAAKADAAAADTFKDVVERFLKYQASRLRATSLYSTKLYLLERCKRLHGLRIEQITRREIASILSSINENSGAVSADCARAALSAMFAWAMKEGLCETNPTMATNTYAGIVKRDRVLTPEEIVAIWSALPDNDYGTIIKLLFYTAARRDEIGEMTWSELKLADRQIEVPAERSKNHRPFLLPLSASAMELLSKVVQDDKRFVFGQRTNGFSGWSKAKTGLDAKLKIAPWQLRDIRRTVATGMAELGIEPHIVEACLNHVSGHKAGVAGVYNRAAYAEPKRKAFEIWETHINTLLAQDSGANVVKLKGKRRS